MGGLLQNRAASAATPNTNSHYIKSPSVLLCLSPAARDPTEPDSFKKSNQTYKQLYDCGAELATSARLLSAPVRNRRHTQAAARPASVKPEAVAQAVKPPPRERLPTRLPGKGASPPSEEEGRDNSSIRESMSWKAGRELLRSL